MKRGVSIERLKPSSKPTCLRFRVADPVRAMSSTSILRGDGTSSNHGDAIFLSHSPHFHTGMEPSSSSSSILNSIHPSRTVSIFQSMQASQEELHDDDHYHDLSISSVDLHSGSGNGLPQLTPTITDSIYDWSTLEQLEDSRHRDVHTQQDHSIAFAREGRRNEKRRQNDEVQSDPNRPKKQNRETRSERSQASFETDETDRIASRAERLIPIETYHNFNSLAAPSGDKVEDEPLYVNPKQYDRIVKRRAMREAMKTIRLDAWRKEEAERKKGSNEAERVQSLAAAGASFFSDTKVRVLCFDSRRTR